MYCKEVHRQLSDISFYCRVVEDLSRVKLESFINFVNDFHPALQFTWEISETSISFLNIPVSINGNRLTTSVFHKLIDSHSYLLYSSFHPNHTKRSIPFSQFLRLRRLSSEDEDFQFKCPEMKTFFVKRGYPSSLIDTALSKATHISRLDTLRETVSSTPSLNPTPLVLTHHPFNFFCKGCYSSEFSSFAE